MHLAFSFSCEVMEIKPFVRYFLELPSASEVLQVYMTTVSQWNPEHPKGPKDFAFTD